MTDPAGMFRDWLMFAGACALSLSAAVVESDYMEAFAWAMLALYAMPTPKDAP